MHRTMKVALAMLAFSSCAHLETSSRDVLTQGESTLLLPLTAEETEARLTELLRQAGFRFAKRELIASGQRVIFSGLRKVLIHTSVWKGVPHTSS